MAHLLFIISGKTSIVLASCALAKRLTAAGHRITFASPAATRDRVTAEGLAHIPLDVNLHAPPDKGRALLRLARLRARRRAAARALDVERTQETVRRVDPDAVLIEIELHPAIIGTVPLGRPTGLLCSFQSIFAHPGIPPMHRSLIPRPGLAGRLAVAWSWATYRFTKWWFLRSRWLRRLGCDRTSILRTLAGQTGFDFKAEVDTGQWMLPFSYRRLPVIYVTPLELDFPHTPGPNVRHAGPMVDLDRPEPSLTPADESRLETLMTRRRTDPSRRLAVCVLSTVAAGDVDFTRRVIAALGNHGDIDVVLGLGGRLAPETLGPLPDNVHALQWLPVLRILPHADIALINAGPNAIVECIMCGVPSLVVSLDRNDQNGHAARVAFHGLGVRTDRRAGPAKIRTDVERVLGDASYRTRVEGMRAKLLEYDRRHHAARMIEALLLTGPARDA